MRCGACDSRQVGSSLVKLRRLDEEENRTLRVSSFDRRLHDGY